MKPKILQTLRLTYAQYDNYRESCFMRWCQKYAHLEAISLRALYSHDGLRNYYQTHWLISVEKAFLKDNAEYLALEDVTLELQDLFLTYPKQLEENYPKALLELIKKETHENKINRRTNEVRKSRV